MSELNIDTVLEITGEIDNLRRQLDGAKQKLIDLVLASRETAVATEVTEAAEESSVPTTKRQRSGGQNTNRKSRTRRGTSEIEWIYLANEYVGIARTLEVGTSGSYRRRRVIWLTVDEAKAVRDIAYNKRWKRYEKQLQNGQAPPFRPCYEKAAEESTELEAPKDVS